MKQVLTVLCALIIISVHNFGQEAPKGKIYGYIFGDYYYNIARDNNFSSLSNTAHSGDKDLNGFQLRRLARIFGTRSLQSY